MNEDQRSKAKAKWSNQVSRERCESDCARSAVCEQADPLKLRNRKVLINTTNSKVTDRRNELCRGLLALVADYSGGYPESKLFSTLLPKPKQYIRKDITHSVNHK
ncbi:hypothetical protein WAI453_013405 [Rhynchosporium graminicola]